MAAIVAVIFLSPLPGAAAKKTTISNASPEISEKQADLGELRSRIDSLRKELSSSEENKADAGDRLRESERQISRLQRELYELGDQRGQLQKTLQNLELQSKELSSTLGQQQSQLEKLLYRQYLRGTPDSLQLILNATSCETCHSTSTWANAKPDHAAFNAATNCASCHDGQSAAGKPSGHIPVVSANCSTHQTTRQRVDLQTIGTRFL